MDSGDHKPFYSHLKAMKSSPSAPLRLKVTQDSDTQDPETIADCLNRFFQSQFSTEHTLVHLDPPPVAADRPSIDVNQKGLVCLIEN